MPLSDILDRLPPRHRDKARPAVAAAFGRAAVTVLDPITTGASASSYRLEIGGRPYLLRLEADRRDEVRDPARAYACMRVAVEAGLAPALHHADPTAGVAILDYVPRRPLVDYPGGPAALAQALGEMAARLQATPLFPALSGYPVVLEGLLGELAESGLFAPGLLDQHRAGFERIRDAYPWDDGALVSSHNDPHPDNILFDGTRLWLIDWETAYRNDPLVDVAIFTMHFATTPDLEGLLLRAWLGSEPDRAVRARLLLMRLLVLIFYGCASSLYARGLPGIAPATDFGTMTPAGFRAAIDSGRLALGAPETQLAGGKVALARFLERLASPALERALIEARL